MGVSEKRQNFHFGVEYPFKLKKLIACVNALILTPLINIDIKTHFREYMM